MCEVATFLKVGTTALMLKMIEDELCPTSRWTTRCQALHEVSWDPTCRQTVKLDGRAPRPAAELQWDYLDHAKKYVKENDATAENGEVLQRWEAVLTRHRGGPAVPAPRAGLGGEVPAARRRTASGTAWTGTTRSSRMIALQYHDVRRSKGLYYRLARRGQGRADRVRTQEVERAIMEPPEDTRAYFRGRCIDRYPDAIAAASWDSHHLRHGRETLCSACRCASRFGARGSTSRRCSSPRMRPTARRSADRTPRLAGLPPTLEWPDRTSHGGA